MTLQSPQIVPDALTGASLWFAAGYAASSAPFTFFLLQRLNVRGDIALLLICLAMALLSVAFYLAHHDILYSISSAGLSLATHIASAVLITISYRLSPLHPLASFPGPTVNKITSLKLAHAVYTGKRHLLIRRLHEKYGVFVRTGPNTLSINTPRAVAPIYASSKCMDKSNAYLLGPPQASGLFFILGREKHNERRTIWANAFTPSALSSYWPSLERRTKQLVTCLEDRAGPGGSLNMTECLQHWSYDIMGDIVFGGSNRIELMSEGDPNEYVKCGQVATAAFEVLGEVPWLFDLLWYLPPTQDIHALERFAEKLLEERRQDSQSNGRDLCAHLLGEHVKPSFPLTKDELNVDALFAVQAGSDSTASVLTFAIYSLLSNPQQHQRLQAELDVAFRDPTSIDHNILQGLPYLNAVVDESLRLGTPFPGLPRVVPGGGIVIEGKFIPAGTIVGVPAYTQQVSSENFWPEPLRFLPERWISQEGETETIARRSAIMCFSYGPFSCLGKNLAIQELRVAIAHLLLNFELCFSPDFDCDLFASGITNMRTTLFGYPLQVCIKQKRQ